MIDSYKTMFAYSIESIENLEISPRIIMIDGDNAIIDGYYHFKIISISQTTKEHTNPIELSVVKDNGTWKISAIKASYNIEKYKINSLLNQYQIAMKNMEVATLVSLCTFPLMMKAHPIMTQMQWRQLIKIDFPRLKVLVSMRLLIEISI
jgi:hypothetical protein